MHSIVAPRGFTIWSQFKRRKMNPGLQRIQKLNQTGLSVGAVRARMVFQLDTIFIRLLRIIHRYFNLHVNSLVQVPIKVSRIKFDASVLHTLVVILTRSLIEEWRRWKHERCCVTLQSRSHNVFVP